MMSRLKRTNTRRSTLISLLFLLVALTALDMLTTATSWRFILYGHFLFNAIFPVLGFALFVVVTRNPRFSAILVGLFCALLYLGNYKLYVYWDRYLVPAHLDLLASDLKITQVLVEIVDIHMFIAALVTVVPVVALAVVLAMLAMKKSRKQEHTISARTRLVTLFVVVGLTFGLYAGSGAVLSVMSAMQMKPRDWDMAEQIKYGLFNHLYIAAAQPLIFDRMVQGDPSLIVDQVENKPVLVSAARSTKPDIVMMLAESMIDPMTLRADLHTDPMAALRADGRRNRASGLVRVHTVGGRSWLSEYALLTGIPSNLFSVEATRPFALAGGKTWSIAQSVKAQGYRAIAMYAAPADALFPAKEAYLSLGFDEFLDVPDMRARFGEADGTDDGIMLNAASEILQEDDQPVFLFLVSHDLHMPYPPIRNSLYVDQTVGTPEMQEYFRRLQVFSMKTAAFIDDLEKSQAPALFAAFGDHVPPMPRDFEKIGFRTGMADPLYFTPYLIFSNYRRLELDPSSFDVSYAPGLVLDLAQLDGGQFFRINSSVRMLCDGEFKQCGSNAELLHSYYAYLSTNIRAE
jgi:phosphoglycerol transferase MdoB-like AlkP superfamily enzyme